MIFKHIVIRNLAAGLWFGFSVISPGQTASELAQPAKRPEGAPKLSDVSMRLFRKYDDQREIATAKAFHITRADWCYIRDADYIKKVHDLGWSFQGSMNAVTMDADHAMRDEEGKPVLDHFKKAGRYWADSDNPAYRKWYLAELKAWIKAGADSIQRDEPTTIRHTPIPKAAAFHKEMHAIFEKEIGRQVPMSCNLAWNASSFGGDGEPVAEQFDFGMAEITSARVRADYFLKASRDARERNKAIILTASQDFGVPKFRLAIAGCYATGTNMIVPWDQYAGVGKLRVFSKPEDLADLYGFVRANAAYLDGYEDVAAAGHQVKDKQVGSSEIEIEPISQASAFIRAKPGDAKAPVVIHLIDWNQPEPFKIKLRKRFFFESGELSATLCMPLAYDQPLHDKAEQSKDYSPLKKEISLPARDEGDWLVLEIPALNPWAMLIISKVKISE